MRERLYDYALKLSRELYKRHSAGCCLHIVLDDGNTRDSSVRFCQQYAKEQYHADCLALADELLALSQTQRKKLRRLLHDLG